MVKNYESPVLSVKEIEVTEQMALSSNSWQIEVEGGN